MFFFFNDTATTEIYTLSLHDALPIYIFGALAQFERSIIRERTNAGLRAALARGRKGGRRPKLQEDDIEAVLAFLRDPQISRSEEHTSELQSRQYLVCRLLLEKKKTTT